MLGVCGPLSLQMFALAGIVVPIGMALCISLTFRWVVVVGLPVKMPAFGRLSAALNAPQPQAASR